MNPFTLVGVSLFALFSLGTLAFRAVRSPFSLIGARRQQPPASGTQMPTVPHILSLAGREPTVILTSYLAYEIRHHTTGLDMARALQKQHSANEARDMLESERVRHARVASELNKLLPPPSGNVVKFFEQKRLDAYYGNLRAQRIRGNKPLDVPVSVAEPEKKRGLFKRGRRGPCDDLVLYYTRQLGHYQVAQNQAQQYNVAGAQDDALARLVDELAYHLKMSRTPDFYPAA